MSFDWRRYDAAVENSERHENTIGQMSVNGKCVVLNVCVKIDACVIGNMCDPEYGTLFHEISVVVADNYQPRIHPSASKLSQPSKPLLTPFRIVHSQRRLFTKFIL